MNSGRSYLITALTCFVLCRCWEYCDTFWSSFGHIEKKLNETSSRGWPHCTLYWHLHCTYYVLYMLYSGFCGQSKHFDKLISSYTQCSMHV